MKAILVIDKPKNCYECSLCAEEVIYGKTEFVCKGYGSIIESLDGNDWCPLSHPLKRVGHDYYIYDRKYLLDNLDREIEMLKKVKEYESNISG